jgi:selenocysteine lyase/cysteine desulfurase
VASPAATDLPGRVRHRFPILARRVYVDSCSQGALSDSVRDAYEEYLRSWEEEGSPWERWVERAEEARVAFARLIGGRADEVAVTTSLSQGVDALLSGLRFADGRDTIVVTDFEFPTVGQIAHAQELLGRRVVHVPADGGELHAERFATAVDERTALVCVTAVCYRNGARTDVGEVVRIARERGALVLLDAYQAAGTSPLDVRALGVDFLAAGCVKYLLGSAGLAFLWCREELVAAITPTVTGWFADEDVFAMDVHDYSPAPTARRFEAGTPPIPAAYAGVAGMGVVEEMGVAEIEAQVAALTARLVSGLDELGAEVATPREASRRGALVAVRSTDEHALVAALDADGIITSSRDGCLRVSFHGYNTAEDVDAVLAALAGRRHLLRLR